MRPESIAAIASAFVATAGLFSGLWIAWMKSRESALRRGDVLDWANEVIRDLESLFLIGLLEESYTGEGLFKDSHSDRGSENSRITEVVFSTAILIERGRLFFKNSVIDGFGEEKEAAYRGYRPRILDPIVIAHKIARAWETADLETPLRMRLVAEDCLKQFVSLVQKEIGRDRTASADTGKGGEGSQLGELLAKVNERRLSRARRP